MEQFDITNSCEGGTHSLGGGYGGIHQHHADGSDEEGFLNQPHSKVLKQETENEIKLKLKGN